MVYPSGGVMGHRLIGRDKVGSDDDAIFAMFDFATFSFVRWQK